MRPLPIALAVCFATLAGPADAGRLLPEMELHLGYAQRYADTGQISGAVAHADIVSGRRALRLFIEADQDNETAAVWAACERWNRALGVEAFAPAEDLTNADLVVRFKPHLVSNCRPIGGFVRWSRAVTYQSGAFVATTRAEVDIRSLRPTGGRMTFAQTQHVAGHELGHVLGLDDSPRSGDLMGPLTLTAPVAGPTEDEVAALRAMRRRADDVRLHAIFALIARSTP